MGVLFRAGTLRGDWAALSSRTLFAAYETCSKSEVVNRRMCVTFAAPLREVRAPSLTLLVVQGSGNWRLIMRHPLY